MADAFLVAFRDHLYRLRLLLDEYVPRRRFTTMKSDMTPTLKIENQSKVCFCCN